MSLVEAVKKNNYKLVEKIINTDFKMSKCNEEAFYYAIKNNNYKIAKLLIKLGYANINKLVYNGWDGKKLAQFIIQ
jgi:hypothetical protein